MPDPPARPTPPAPHGPGADRPARDIATMIALVALVGFTGGLLTLVAMVTDRIFVCGLLAVIVGFSLYVGLHYIVWGRRLSKRQGEAPPRNPNTE